LCRCGRERERDRPGERQGERQKESTWIACTQLLPNIPHPPTHKHTHTHTYMHRHTHTHTYMHPYTNKHTHPLTHTFNLTTQSNAERILHGLRGIKSLDYPIKLHSTPSSHPCRIIGPYQLPVVGAGRAGDR